jgi:hypothetical protein
MLMERKGLVKYLLDGDEKGAKKITFVVITRVTTEPRRREIAGNEGTGPQCWCEPREHGWKKSH